MNLCCFGRLRVRKRVKIKLPKLVIVVFGGRFFGKSSKIRKRCIFYFFIANVRLGLGLCFPIFLFVLQVLEALIIDPHLKLIDKIRHPGDPKEMSLDIMHKIKISIKNTSNTTRRTSVRSESPDR